MGVVFTTPNDIVCKENYGESRENINGFLCDFSDINGFCFLAMYTW
jgi:hypothetical protein